ncbi:galactose ABC transporter substrate-binding protein [Clostridium chromiireducens]|uniref:D-galactose/methyl-galactoside binding periplasmic protein MglB n=1 Tax=Clostridium chromiireducens TaxID=225345 RepID=A0A1V4J076_9CLOT|nr:galactose ABC transporter substrate-binding protein [Clostridium chromiireducens]OPJ65414.1 D-galactose-binding periplasmic protein precursor [Clostridium chromiireducens]
MKIIKKLLYIIMFFIFLLQSSNLNAYASINSEIPYNIAVFINDFNDLFISDVMKNLENIQKENKTKVNFTFFDARGNQVIQNQNIDNALNDNFDLFVVNPVSTNIDELNSVLTKITQKNIPLIIYYAQTKSIINFIRPYRKGIIIDTDIEQSGILQGKILSDIWASNNDALDRNKDGVMQYVMLKGPANSPETIARSKYSIQTLNDERIRTEELTSIACNWDKNCAKSAIESYFLKNGNKIEAIIANNDAMAIGAIEALQKYGYNKGDNSKYIPVVGVDALPEAQELIKRGLMTGTVVQDPVTHANAIYTIGMNLISGDSPLNGTNYKFDNTGTTVRLPYTEYFK